MVFGHYFDSFYFWYQAEQLSYSQLLDYSVIAVMAAIWAVMPSDGIAVVTQWFYNKVMQVSSSSSTAYFTGPQLAHWRQTIGLHFISHSVLQDLVYRHFIVLYSRGIPGLVKGCYLLKLVSRIPQVGACDLHYSLLPTLKILQQRIKVTKAFCYYQSFYPSNIKLSASILELFTCIKS